MAVQTTATSSPVIHGVQGPGLGGSGVDTGSTYGIETVCNPHDGSGRLSRFSMYAAKKSTLTVPVPSNGSSLYGDVQLSFRRLNPVNVGVVGSTDNVCGATCHFVNGHTQWISPRSASWPGPACA